MSTAHSWSLWQVSHNSQLHGQWFRQGRVSYKALPHQQSHADPVAQDRAGGGRLFVSAVTMGALAHTKLSLTPYVASFCLSSPAYGLHTTSPASSGVLRKYAWTEADQVEPFNIVSSRPSTPQVRLVSKFLLTSALALPIKLKPNDDRRKVPANESYSLPPSLRLPPLSFF
jgi:hypothetical protein